MGSLFSRKDVIPSLPSFKVRLRTISELVKSYASVKEEMGDLLFTLVNFSRKLNVDPEEALRGTNSKFIKRFSYIERTIDNNGENINFVSQEKLEDLWLDSKSIDV